MFVLKNLFGKIWNDPNAAELAQIASGQFYLVRPGTVVKGKRECIFQNAMAAIRRVPSAEFQFQLVITRVFEQGEENLLDEEEEVSTERAFLIDEVLGLRAGEYEGEPTIQWRDLDSEEDLCEFVAHGTNEPTRAFFMTALYKAMYERKYSQSSEDASEEDLTQFVFKSEPTAGAVRSQLERQPVVHSTGGANLGLYLWNVEKAQYERLGTSDIEGSIVENGPGDFWVLVKGPNVHVESRIQAEMNPRFAERVTSVTWNHITPDGIPQSYCIRFNEKDPYEQFKAVFAQCQYEALHGIAWDRVKADEQQYAMSSYSTDVEMADATQDQDDADEVDAVLDPEEESSEDEEEEEKESYQRDSSAQAKAFDRKGKNTQLVVSDDRSYVTNSGAIGVFKNSNDMGELEYIATITKILSPKGTRINPKKMMLHDQDTAMVIQNDDAPHSLWHLDIEAGKIVEEWKVHDDITVDHIAPNTKFAQKEPERTLVGASHNSLFRIDPRVSGNKMVDNEYKQYATKNRFSSLATTGGGKLAVASEKGDIRLFDSIGKNAKTALPALGDPITGIDVTADGRYTVATTKTYLLFLDNLIGSGRYAGQLGFDRSFPADSKPIPRRLQLKPEHATYMGSVSFTPAKFNSTENGKETSIVTASGKFVIAWDLAKVIKGKTDKYEIKAYGEKVVQDDFRFGTDGDIIVALEDNVLGMSKRQLKPATRKSLSTPVRDLQSRSSIVNAPY